MINIDLFFLKTKLYHIVVSEKNEIYISTNTNKFEFDLGEFYIWKDPCLFLNYTPLKHIYKINTNQVMSSIVNFKFFFYEMITIFNKQVGKLILCILNNNYKFDLTMFENNLPLIYNCKFPIICKHLLVLISKLLTLKCKNIKNDFYFRCKCFSSINKVPVESYLSLKTYTLSKYLTSFNLCFLPKTSIVFNLLNLLNGDIVSESKESNVYIISTNSPTNYYILYSEKLFTDKILNHVICAYENVDSIYITETHFIKFLSVCIHNKYN